MVMIMFVVQRSDTMNILKKLFYGNLTPYEYEQSAETEYSGVVEHLRRLKLNSVVGVN